MTVVSRLQLNHPVLGTAGGTGLHASIEALFKKIGDNTSDRFFYVNNLANSGTEDLLHNFTTAFANLRIEVYKWNDSTQEVTLLDESTTPKLSDFTLQAKSGAELTTAQIVNNSGSQQDLAVAIFLDPIDWTAKTGFNKVVGTKYFATLTAAAPAAGDRILVLNSYTLTDTETLAVSDCEIVFMPNAKLTFSVASKFLKFIGNRNRIVNPHIICTDTGSHSDALVINGDHNEVRGGRIEANNAGITLINAYSVINAGVENFIEGIEWATAGSVTNKISDGGVDTEYAIRGSAA